MKTILITLLQVIVISGILYGYYHFFLRNKKFHGYNRFYLLSAIVISIVVPFLNIPVYFVKEQIDTTPILQTIASVTSGNFEHEGLMPAVFIETRSGFNWKMVTWSLYVAGIILLFTRFLVSVIKILRLKKKYTQEKINNINFINTDEPSAPFSFFRNLFWNKKIALDSEHGQQMLRHECFHIERNHSYDIVFAEMVSIVFWMNPFFYLIKKEIKTIHEFLADQFTATANEEWNYAELLLMQVLGSPNNHLSNHFFHNQIKRRITMITTSKKPGYQYGRKLLVLPVAILITALFAFKYKPMEVHSPLHTSLEKQITVIIDAGHGESDPGVIASDGTKESDITLQLAQKVKLLNKNDRIHIVLTRNSKEAVDLKTRSNIANAQNPDLFISLHVSATDNKIEMEHYSGFEVYISKKNTTHFAENRILGGILLNYFMNLYKTTAQVQTPQTGVWVLDNSNCPSALVECGYMTNTKDLAFVKNAANQSKIAEGILNSIEQFAIQKSLPDFDDKKKRVSDTSQPDVKINKSSAAKISATLNGKAISSVIMDAKSGSAGFILEDKSLTVIPKQQVDLLQSTYGKLWNEFCDVFTQKENKL